MSASGGGPSLEGGHPHFVVGVSRLFDMSIGWDLIISTSIHLHELVRLVGEHDERPASHS